MSKPAARISDMHTCPMVTPGTPPVPHVGGPVMGPGVPNVLIGGQPAAVLGDMCTCTGPPDTIILGSTGVFIGGKPAARMGDSTAHGGIIAAGCPTVLIGEVSGGAASGAGLSSGSFQTALDELEEVGTVPASKLSEMKVVSAQIAAMKNAATTGKALCHNPDCCSQCNA